MKELTERQKVILEYIERYQQERRCPPTIREISDNFRISVKGGYDHLKALEKKGYLRLGENRSRSIEILGKTVSESPVTEIPILGNVAAGKPIFADENFEDTVFVPSAMVNKGRCFALRVRGDSMMGAGILDGDVAVIEQKQLADNGDIVVAMLEDSVTLKRFYREKGRIRLAAENPAYAPIFTQDVRILGRLRGIIRNY
jgi:repressor LexA